MPALPRGLAPYLQPGEHVRLSIPAIWVTGSSSSASAGQQNDVSTSNEQPQERQSTTCDVVLTNQRLLGYARIRFPRERLFLESFSLNTLTAVSLRQKSFEPLFHELLVSDGQRRAYIRSSRPRIEQLYAALRSIEKRTSSASPFQQEETGAVESSPTSSTVSPVPVYGRQDIRRSFEQSPLGIILLFVGGLLLEVTGIILWSATSSIQIGLPLCVAGLACVVAATAQRRRHHV